MAIFHIIFLFSRETDVSEALGRGKGLKQEDSIKVKVPIVPPQDTTANATQHITVIPPGLSGPERQQYL